MNNLKYVLTEFNKRGLNQPYRPFRQNEILSATPGSKLWSLAESYYPRSNYKFIVKAVHVFESESDFDYEILPINYNKTVQTSHYNLRSKNLIETKMFVPVKLLKYGVAVKSMADLKEHVVANFSGTDVIYDDGSIADFDSLVHILRRSDDSSKLNYFLDIK